ncbi:MAG TPA: AI-2E family transporter [Candidatus Saccharimonadales bacterium]|nr:AI-2E family transporter [Candidatus Saccharimonadales bacterium]
MKSDLRVTVNVTNRTIVRAILWVVATIIAFHFFSQVSDILKLIFASFFFALALAPAVGWISRKVRFLNRVGATALSYIVIIAIIAAFFALVTPPLVRQTRDFIKTVPQLVDNFQHQNGSIARAARKYNLDQKITKSADKFASNYGNFGSTLLDTGKRILGIVVSILAVLVMTFMMLVEGPYWLDLLWGTVPDKNRARYKQMAYRMYKGVSGFVNGQVIVALLAGFFAFLALEIASHIIGVSGINPLALAGIVAVLGLIPLFGNPISSIIVILFSLLNSVTLAIVMLIYFLVYYFIENHTFQPYIQSRLNKLTALSVFIAALLGIAFAGFLGAIVAIPVASAIKVLLEDHYRGRRPDRYQKDASIKTV